MKETSFIKGVERLINPIDVGTLHFMQGLNDFLPTRVQKKMVAASAKKNPQMGFVVEPYSYFLCYEIADLHKASTYLPDGFKLIKTKIFEDTEPTYYGIIGCFSAHTSGFWGLRIECYIIAENTHTGLLSWIIMDYDTNTITYDPKNGLSSPNAPGSIITTDYNGTLHVDVINKTRRALKFESDLTCGEFKSLDKRLWIEGNLSVAYGKHKIDGDPGIFSLTFKPEEFSKALSLPKESLNLISNTWFPELFESKPKELVCFPFAQHFLSDSPGFSSQLSNESELTTKVNRTNFDQIKVFSTESFKKMFLLSGTFSFAITATLLTLLILK
jgi:hypothetical protein